MTNRANTDILRQPTADAWGRNGAPAYVWEGLMGSWSPPVRACLRCLGGDCRRCSADPLTMSERARVGEPGTVRYL